MLMKLTPIYQCYWSRYIQTNYLGPYLSHITRATCAVRLGYYEKILTDQICSLKPGIVITWLICALNGYLGMEILLVTTEFVKTELQYT